MPAPFDGRPSSWGSSGRARNLPPPRHLTVAHRLPARRVSSAITGFSRWPEPSGPSRRRVCVPSARVIESPSPSDGMPIGQSGDCSARRAPSSTGSVMGIGSDAKSRRALRHSLRLVCRPCLLADPSLRGEIAAATHNLLAICQRAWRGRTIVRERGPLRYRRLDSRLGPGKNQ